MLTSAVLAVVLGLTPVNDERTQIVTVSPQTARLVGRYSEFVDRRGRKLIRGFDHLGRNYEVTIDQSGYVEGTVGDRFVNFHVSDAP